MIGTYTVSLAAKRVEFFLELKKNITVIAGNSGSGKTTFVNLLDTHMRSPRSVLLMCDVPVIHLIEQNWAGTLRSISNSIVVLDADDRFVIDEGETFSDIVKNTDNYFVIMSRNPLNFLPDNIKEEFEFYRDNGDGSTRTRVCARPLSSK